MAMNYRQLNIEDRSTLTALRKHGLGVCAVAEHMRRHRTTLWRELRRNASPHDGRYRASRANEYARARRRRSRRNRHFDQTQMTHVEELLRREWSPEQVSGHLRRKRVLSISHETIYRHIWRDETAGGSLHLHLRGARKQCRKRYGRYDSRGRLSGKRLIGERPACVAGRRHLGHWEIDTVMGTSFAESSACILTLVERKTGYTLIGKLSARTVQQATQVTLALMRRHPGKFRTITADNGTEFHGYLQIEALSAVHFYFATPHHSWERGTNENTNGLIRQYLPKGQSMESLTQAHCDVIATKLNQRPRKRHAYKTPTECFLPN
jgi:transposase, IS30 family